MTPKTNQPLRHAPLQNSLRHSLCAGVLALAIITLPGGFEPAAAQDPTYSAEEVSKHFKQLKTRSLKPTGATRALCIGTRDECNPNASNEGGGQVAVSPEGSAETETAETLVVDPETQAIDDAFNLLVSFEYASARLSNSAKANLREFAKGINVADLEGAKFVIEGHTDGIGSISYNQRLSEDRAQAVTQFLISLGVSQNRLKTVAYGESRPKVADINDPANRRVESKLVLE
ncbi:OmpA family protein [Roseibium porphyridii]|uniref:OmpA family protein n=1 Tax=Roseibium porphyridii TaxID=2866279 RepID=A0ABY8EXL2_9HYPH|nr:MULTISPECIES: OmpA family protein [Stappiaceae]QFT32452.1 Outer membrane porin F precursor [Labrenzia sp. THAF82]WFE87788.1 OmpA family protein [Roseibium sp. KMA01]